MESSIARRSCPASRKLEHDVSDMFLSFAPKLTRLAYTRLQDRLGRSADMYCAVKRYFDTTIDL